MGDHCMQRRRSQSLGRCCMRPFPSLVPSRRYANLHSVKTGKLHHTFSGHFEEVTGLALLGQMLLSVSIDCTIRQWSLKPKDLQAAIAAAEEAKVGEETPKSRTAPLITEDEERELAE